MLLVIGDEIIDETVAYKSQRRCPEGDWPIVNEVDRAYSPGGASAVHAMVRALGEECWLVGQGRCDSTFTTKRRHVLDGVTVFREDLDHVQCLNDKILPMLSGIQFSPSVVLIADYGKGAVSHDVVRYCVDRGWRVVIDPHPSQSPDIYRGCCGITPNRSENDAYDYFADHRYPNCCLKLDEDGMRIRDETGSIISVESSCQELVDVCGAGDQVLASIGVALVSGQSWIDACRFANHTAGLKCQKVGCTPVTASEAFAVA